MSRRKLLRITLALIGCWTLACSKGSPGGEGDDQVPTQPALEEVAQLVKQHVDDTRRPPRRLEDLSPYEPGLVIGYEGLKRGEVILFYGAGLSGDAKTVLAYEKDVPADGGYVLMQDGTVKRMTAQEFAAAPKAGRK